MSEREQYPPQEPEGTQPHFQKPGPPKDPIVGDEMGTGTGADEVHGTTDTGENRDQQTNA